ncbi:MAG TPA: porin [Burkholderiaceae bacterium]|nr:porin [Burkholderiaceae bacterium]
MKKKNWILAAGLAAMPLATLAQSSVTLGGQIKTGVDQVHYTGGTVANAPVANPESRLRVTDNSSWWFVKGEEDLGDGNKAFFHVEFSFSADTGDAGRGRFSAVGLSNPAWGRVLLGQWPLYFSSDAIISPNGILDAGPYAGGTLNLLGPIGRQSQYFSGGFLSNTLRYDSPRWSGFGFSAAYSFDTEAAGQNGHRTLNLNPTYIAGPVILYWNHLDRGKQPGVPGNFATAYDQTADRLGASYLFGSGLKLAALWDRNTVEGSAIAGGKLSRDAWALPLSYRNGLHLVSATYGQAKSYKTGGTTSANTGAKMFALGYEYALSKRTFLAASYSTIRNESRAGYDFWFPANSLAKPAGFSGFDSRYLYAGIKHSF